MSEYQGILNIELPPMARYRARRQVSEYLLLTLIEVLHGHLAEVTLHCTLATRRNSGSQSQQNVAGDPTPLPVLRRGDNEPRNLSASSLCVTEEESARTAAFCAGLPIHVLSR